MSEIINIQDVAKRYNKHPNDIRLMCRAGRLPAFKVGKQWLVNYNDLLKWEKAGGHNR